MIRFFRFAPLVCAYFLFAFTWGLSPLVVAAESVPNEYIVKFAGSLPPVTQHTIMYNLNITTLHSSGLTGSIHVYSKDKLNNAYVKQLLAQGTIDYIEPNYLYSIQSTPNDPYFDSLWAMLNIGQDNGRSDIDIDTPEAWDITTGDSDLIVGILDTGVNYTHSDLSQNIWRNPNEIPDNGIDDDQNGVIDDFYGFNAIDYSGDPYDDNSHGTHVAGIIGARGNNGQGVVGTNWTVKLLPLKFISASGFGNTNDAIQAIEYAIQLKQRGFNLRILNASWGGFSKSQALKEAIEAAGKAGILFVAAAGNKSINNDNTPIYPANYALDNVISVAAIDNNGNRASFSNYGSSSVHLAAPGVAILSTIPGGYGEKSGTSMAAPFASGTAGLLLALEPSLTPYQVKNRLIKTSKPASTLKGVIQANGILSAYRALNNLQSPTSPNNLHLKHYSRSNISYSFEHDKGVRILINDDEYALVTLPFPIPFYGIHYSRLAVSSNGRILPLTEAEELPRSSDFDLQLRPGISPLHTDLISSHTSDGGVWVKYATDHIVLTWISKYAVDRNIFTDESILKFQVKLFPDGNIEFHYADTESGNNFFAFGRRAYVGLMPIKVNQGTKLLIDSLTDKQSTLSNNSAVRFHPHGIHAQQDFDGDGISDIVVWRPGEGNWYLLPSSTGFKFETYKVVQLGLPGDIPLSGDFDKDGIYDMAVWRPENGNWYFRKSSENFDTISSIQWGLPGDTPLLGDFDGDGYKDLTVFRKSNGVFYSLLSGGEFNRSAALKEFSVPYVSIVNAGGNAFDPLAADITGDGRDEYVSVWQPARVWSVKDYSGLLLSAKSWGVPGDEVHVCDMDADSRADRVVIRPGENELINWFIATQDGHAIVQQFGLKGDRVACNSDYDGDGRNDMRSFRNSFGLWFIKQSSDGSEQQIQFGLPGDIPL